MITLDSTTALFGYCLKNNNDYDGTIRIININGDSFWMSCEFNFKRGTIENQNNDLNLEKINNTHFLTRYDFNFTDFNRTHVIGEVNLSILLEFYDNTSGYWVKYGEKYIYKNDTYFILDSNFNSTNISYYWYVNVTNCTTEMSSIFYFETNDMIGLSGIFDDSQFMIIIALVMLAYGVFKKDGLIGFLNCTGAVVILLIAIISGELTGYFPTICMIIGFVASGIAIYKVFLEIDTEGGQD
jgi:hypothetical protein